MEQIVGVAAGATGSRTYPRVGDEGHRLSGSQASKLLLKIAMDSRKLYLLVSAASAILTFGNATQLSEANEPRNSHLPVFARGLPPQQTEESLRRSLAQSGFKNVHCDTVNGFVHCKYAGLSSFPISNAYRSSFFVCLTSEFSHYAYAHTNPLIIPSANYLRVIS